MAVDLNNAEQQDSYREDQQAAVMKTIMRLCFICFCFHDYFPTITKRLCFVNYVLSYAPCSHAKQLIVVLVKDVAQIYNTQPQLSSVSCEKEVL